ncbi:MFS transporter [Pseudomonas syringae]|uniref:MFS transporter n=1 Tax=Pseudomonas syringae TaxID=317 RepID=UPI00041B88D1|nr:MFS transporter [Pseudomonas syringae]QGG74529.1 MFS transporter [Pseudomonas syringae USA011]
MSEAPTLKPNHAEVLTGARRWMCLAILLVGSFLPPLDYFIINIALPFIKADLRASDGMMQASVSIYAAAFALFLILGGRLGDSYGARRTFIVGMRGFAFASAACGMAGSDLVLVVGRFVQGLFAAIMAPQSLALIHANFIGKDKALALSLYASIFGLACLVGQGAGGLLIEANIGGLSWRSLFLINLPVVLLCLLAAVRLLTESTLQQSKYIDIRGCALFAGFLLPLLACLIEAAPRGWPWWSWLALTLSAFCLKLFVTWENQLKRGGRAPFVDLAIFNLPPLLPGVLALFCFYAISPFFLIYADFLQSGFQLSPAAVGARILPFGIGFFIAALSSAFLGQRQGKRGAMLGLSLQAASMLSVVMCICGGRPDLLYLPLILLGAGQGFALPAMVGVVSDTLNRHHPGMSSGLINTVLQCSSAFFVASVGGVFFGVENAIPGIIGLSDALVAATSLILVCQLLALLLIRISISREAASTAEH